MSVYEAAPTTEMMENVQCPYCGGLDSGEFINAEEDLTGKPGTFHFVTCKACSLVYQNPRVPIELIGAYYDDEYIAHRKKSDWGMLTGFYNWAMGKHDRDKEALIRRHVKLVPDSQVLDIGCGAGTFLLKIQDRYGVSIAGVDFKDLSGLPGFNRIDFHCGLFYEQKLAAGRFDLITMWHFLEHDYQPLRTLETARQLLHPEGRLVIEVPRLDSLSFWLFRERWPGLQAPQHTTLYTRETLLQMVAKSGLKVVEYLPYGAFPSYFYLFAGIAFKLLKGRGLNLSKAIYPYFLGQLLLFPILLFEKRLNLAMQTVICEKQ